MSISKSMLAKQACKIGPCYSFPVCRHRRLGGLHVCEANKPKQQLKIVTDADNITNRGSLPTDKVFLKKRDKSKGCCYGCGAALQIDVPLGAGYVKPDKYETKKLHRQLHKVLCERCAGLCNGAMLPAVEDFAQKQARMTEDAEERAELLGKLLISPDELRNQLLEVRDKKAIVVMLVDLLDSSGSLLSRVRDIVGRNPIILVGTKLDLLPEGTSPRSISQWLTEMAMRKKLNIASTHLVSSHTQEGMSYAISKICKERKSRDVYVVGAANVGKSAFVRAMLREMGSFESINYDPAAMSSARYMPIESAMPGTTLGIIALQAFESGGSLYDTPGVHLHHRVIHMLSPEHLKLIHPRKRLAPFIPPTPKELNTSSEEDGVDSDPYKGGEHTRPSIPCTATYLWSDIARIDVLEGPGNLSLAVYGPASMKVSSFPLLQDGMSIESEEDAVADPRVLSCAGAVEARGGLVAHDLVIKTEMMRTAAVADIAISGVPGWVTFWAPYARKDLRVRVWAPKGVEVFLRPPLPVPCPIKTKKDAEDDRELDKESMKALAQMYDDDGSVDPMFDANFWESLAALADREEMDSEDPRALTGTAGESVLIGRMSEAMRTLSTTMDEEEEARFVVPDSDPFSARPQLKRRALGGAKGALGRVRTRAPPVDAAE